MLAQPKKMPGSLSRHFFLKKIKKMLRTIENVRTFDISKNNKTSSHEKLSNRIKFKRKCGFDDIGRNEKPP